ncbi:hypothetical protein HDU93_001433, partial [Gonapodya sp. JEL0774]
FNNATYKLAYTRDAGLTPVNSNAKYTSATDFQAALANVDYLIDETFLGTTTFDAFLKTYGLTADSSLKVVKNKQVYRTDLLQNSGAWTAWFEQAVPLAQEVLSDIVNIAYGSTVFPKNAYSNVFLRNIAANVTAFSTSALCTDPVAALSVGTPTTCPSVAASTVVATANGTTAGSPSTASASATPTGKAGAASDRVVAGSVTVAAVVAAVFAML